MGHGRLPRLLRRQRRCGGRRLRQGPAVFFRLQRRIGHLLLQHGGAKPSGLPALHLQGFQRLILPLQCSLQGKLPRLHLPDGLHRHAQPPQQSDLFQRGGVLLGIVPIAVGPPRRPQQPFLFIKADVGPGDPQPRFQLLDGHRVASFALPCIIKDKAALQSSIFSKKHAIFPPERGKMACFHSCCSVLWPPEGIPAPVTRRYNRRRSVQSSPGRR